MRVRPREPVRGQSARRASHRSSVRGEAIGGNSREHPPTEEPRMQLRVQPQPREPLASAAPLFSFRRDFVFFSKLNDIFWSNAESYA